MTSRRINNRRDDQGLEVSGDTPITQQDMTTRLANSAALALMPEGVPGPVQLDGRWWAVPDTEQDYLPVTDERQLNLLNRSAVRLRRARLATLRGGDR